jgi:hypothetical protein
LSDSGYIDWHSLTRARPWLETRKGQTYVYAFWSVDYGSSNVDRGVSLLKRDDRHPDWFLYAEQADHVLTAYCHPNTLVSKNFMDVFDSSLSARPLLASILLGTANAAYVSLDEKQHWNCSVDDLSRRGKRLVKDLDLLYLRAPTLVTFVDLVTDEQDGPPSPLVDTATVGEGLGGHPPE